MKWKEALWNTYKFATTTAIDLTVTTLNLAGTAACLVGGVGISLSNYMQETLTGGYYGGVDITGNVSLNITILELQTSFPESMPFQENLISTSEGRSFAPKDFADPSMVMWYSTGAVAVGSALRLMGANLSKWQEGRKDFEQYKKEKDLEISTPSNKEYIYTTGESLANSIALASVATLSSKLSLDLLLHFLNDKLFSYPLQSNASVNAQFYNGPVGTKNFPLDFTVSKNVTFDVKSIGIKLDVNEAVNATAITAVNYGGGFFLKPNQQQRIGLGLISSTLAFGAWKAGGFFSDKVRLERDKRVPDGDNSNYLRIA